MRAAALALLLYFASLVLSAPASFLAWALAAATNGVATLEGTQGSVWRGQATSLVILDRLGGTHRYKKLNWEWLGVPLVAGEPALRIEVDDPKLRGAGRITPRMNGLRIGHATMRLPASSLAAYWPALSRAALSGQISVQTEGFILARELLAGTARIAWRDVGSAWSDAKPLGEYRAQVSGVGASAAFQVETVSGPLRVEGRGAWSGSQGLSFEGTARGLPSDTAGLTELLRLLGPDLGGGTYRIRFTD